MITPVTMAYQDDLAAMKDCQYDGKIKYRPEYCSYLNMHGTSGFCIYKYV